MFSFCPRLSRLIASSLLALTFLISAPSSGSATIESARTDAAYQRLLKAIEQYQSIQQQGGWPAVALRGPELRPGQRHADIAVLRNRLRISGDFTGIMQADPYYFSTTLAQALRQFQTRHGLLADSVIDIKTRAELATPISSRLATLQRNKARWQTLPETLGQQYLWVNTAGSYLHLIKDEQVVLSLRAIAGQPNRPTPSLSSTMSHIVTNPDWTVPRRIAVEDLLPLQQRNADFFADKQIRVFAGRGAQMKKVDARQVDWHALSADNFPYWLRQDPGPSNSMGRIKFVFNNPHDIYIHDTPNKVLFELPIRSFSSGCIRVEEPDRLAQALLRLENQLAANSLAERLKTTSTATLPLRAQLPVHIVYFTGWVDSDHLVHFRPDVYNRD